MTAYSALWLLMPWCWSTRPSVSTVLMKNLLYWASFIQRYCIYCEHHKRIKQHFENNDPEGWKITLTYHPICHTQFPSVSVLSFYMILCNKIVNFCHLPSFLSVFVLSPVGQICVSTSLPPELLVLLMVPITYPCVNLNTGFNVFLSPRYWLHHRFSFHEDDCCWLIGMGRFQIF